MSAVYYSTLSLRIKSDFDTVMSSITMKFYFNIFIKKSILLFLIMICFSLFEHIYAQSSENISQRNKLGVESSYYITRTLRDTAERFFPVGAYVSSWPGSVPEYHHRFTSEKEWTSSREIFTLPWTRYHNTVPEWFKSEYPILTGTSHIRWMLRTDSYLNKSCGDKNLSGDDCKDPLGPADQSNISRFINEGNAQAENRIQAAINDINEFALSAGDSDLIFFIQDEPERGFSNWYFHNTLLSYLNDRKLFNTVSYIDLGPATGNLYLYEKNAPDFAVANDLSYYGNDFTHSLGSYEENIKETVRYYKNSADILGINSYSRTISDPENMGNFVSWIHEASDNKPVLPWISAESFRYTQFSTDQVEQSIKQQVYAAITHAAAGIMFYPETDTSAEFWDMVLDIAKELDIFKYYIENGNLYEFNYDHNTHWRTFFIDNNYFLFAVNFGNSPEIPPINKFTDLVIQAGEAGVWHTNNNGRSITRLSAIRNAGFERDINDNSDASGSWSIIEGSDSSRIEINTIGANLKIGERSLEIHDESLTTRASAEQSFNIVPGGVYQVQGWYKGISGNQRLVLQFYDDEQWLEEHQVYGYSTNEWELLKTPVVTAPEAANRIKIHIGSFYDSESLGYWDDIKVNKSGLSGDIR